MSGQKVWGNKPGDQDCHFTKNGKYSKERPSQNTFWFAVVLENIPWEITRPRYKFYLDSVECTALEKKRDELVTPSWGEQRLLSETLHKIIIAYT